MKILFVHRESGFIYGGVENHIRETAKKLAERGNSVTILTEKGKNNPLAKFENTKNIRIVYLPSLGLSHSYKTRRFKSTVSSNVSKTSRLSKFLRIGANLGWMIKSGLWIALNRKNFDVTSVHKFIDTVTLNTLNKFFRMPFVEFLEGYDPIECDYAKKVKYVSTISQYIYDKCKHVHGGYEPALIPIGVELERFRNVRSEDVQSIRDKYCPNGEVLILNVARLVPAKDIPNMIKAAHLALQKNKNLRFIVCGDGEERAPIEKMIKDLNMEDTFFIVKAFGPELPKFYQAADIFLHVPKFANHYGIVYVEAQAAGLPIIAANEEATPSTVGSSALLVEIKDSTQLADAILKLASNKSLREKLSKEAMSRADRIFDLDKTTLEEEKLYKQAASGQ